MMISVILSHLRQCWKFLLTCWLVFIKQTERNFAALGINLVSWKLPVLQRQMLPSGRYASFWNDFLYKDVFRENEELGYHPVELPVKNVSIFHFSSFSTHLKDLAAFGLNFIRSNCLLGDKNSIMCSKRMKSWDRVSSHHVTFNTYRLTCNAAVEGLVHKGKSLKIVFRILWCFK